MFRIRLLNPLPLFNSYMYAGGVPADKPIVDGADDELGVEIVPEIQRVDDNPRDGISLEDIMPVEDGQESEVDPDIEAVVGRNLPSVEKGLHQNLPLKSQGWLGCGIGVAGSGLRFVGSVLAYTGDSVKKNLGYAEKDLIDPKPVIAENLAKIEAAHSTECRDLFLWIADFAGETACSLMDDGWLTSWLATGIGREKLAETVKVNVLEVLANGLEVVENVEMGNVSSDEFFETVDEEEFIGPHADFPPIPGNAIPVQNDGEDEGLIEINQNDDADVPQVNAGADIARVLVDELETVQNEVFVEEIVKPNPFVKLVNLLRAALLENDVDLQEIAFLKKIAELEHLAAQAELNALAVYENPDPKFKRKVRREALQAFLDVLDAQDLGLSQEEKKLAIISLKNNLLLNNKEQRDLAASEAQVKLENASREIERQIENQKRVFAEEIAPRVLSIFLPEGASSIKIYFRYVSVSPFQKKAWQLIQSKTSEYLQELFPFIFQVERPALEALIDANPHARLIRNGIDLLSEDILKIAFDKFKVPANGRNDLKEFAKPYIEFVLMNVFKTFSRLDQESFIQLLEIVGEVCSKLPQNEEFMVKQNDVIELVLKGMMKAIDLLTEEQQDNLFGLPPTLSQIAKKLILSEGLTKIFEYLVLPLHDLKAQKIVDLPEGSIANTSVKVNALSSAITTIMDVQIKKQISNAKVMDNGYSKLVNIASKSLGNALEKKRESYAFAGFIGTLVKDGVFNFLLHEAIELTHTEQAYPLKLQLIQLLKPVLTNFALKGLTPVLEKEKSGGKEFDESLALVILPLITSYLHKLNQPSDVSQSNLDLQANAHKASHFYNFKSQELLQLFLPNGLKSLQDLFPSLKAEDLQMVLDLTGELPSMLASLKDTIFDADFFRDVCISIFENIIQTFTEIPSTNPTSASIAAPTPQEIARQVQLDADLEQLLYEAAKFTDLPIDKLLKIASFVPGHKSLKAIIIKSTREAVQRKLSGDFIEKQVKSTLDGQQNKITVERPANYHEDKLNRLEHQVVVEALLYGLRSISNAIRKALEALDYPVLKQVKDAVVALSSFIIVRIVGGLLRYFGVDTWLVNKIYDILHRNRVRVQAEFAQPVKHEGLAVDIVEAVEKVILKDWKKETITVN